MRAIVIDPKLGIIEEKVIAANMMAAEHMLGSMHDWHMRLPSGDFLLTAKTDRSYRWWVQLFGEVKLIGRCVIVGHDFETDYFADVAIGLDHLRKRIEFRGPDDDAMRLWTSTFSGQLLRPADVGYDEARRVYNGLVDKPAALIARCHGVADVVDAVNRTRKLGH